MNKPDKKFGECNNPKCVYLTYTYAAITELEPDFTKGYCPFKKCPFEGKNAEKSDKFSAHF